MQYVSILKVSMSALSKESNFIFFLALLDILELRVSSKAGVIIPMERVEQVLHWAYQRPLRLTRQRGCFIL